MQRKRQETTAELMDKFQCVHNCNILCINHIEALNFIYLKFRVRILMGGREMHDIPKKWVEHV